MASGMAATPSLIGNLIGVAAKRIGVGGKDAGGGPMRRIKRLGLSPRQQALNQLWSWFCAVNYDVRGLDWNGYPVLDQLETEAFASVGSVPPGFYDAGKQMTPLKFRRPTAPYPLVRVIVNRFTGLLFSERQHPKIQVDGDQSTKDFLNAVADVARLWQQMIQARTFGGATGTAVVGFQFVNGQPLFEVHDPRWTTPTFEDRHALLLRGVEIRYQYPVDIQNPENGEYETVPFWYRRSIDNLSDVLYEPCPVDDGEEPDWKIKARVDHGFGFCPVVWVQNLPVIGDIDGEPDCHGVYPMVEAIDALLSQGNRGIISSCDPTLAIESKSEMPAQVQRGSGTALVVPEGQAKYLEISGTGPKAALDWAEAIRKYALEVAQCVIEHPDVANKTATEIDRAYSSMLAKADVMREQYGEKCIKPLLVMVLKAAQKLYQPVAVTDESGAQTLQSKKLELPAKKVADPVTGTETEQLHHPGTGGMIRLEWPGYFQPSLADMQSAAMAAVAAKQGGLVDAETASKFVAPYFHVEDVKAMLARVQDEQSQQQAELEAMAMGGARIDAPMTGPGAPNHPGNPPADDVTSQVTGAQGQFPPK